MKKILFTAVSALAFASFADGVASTEFGALKVPSTTAQTIVSVPWLESGTGTANVSVSNLVLTAGISDGDTLDLFDTTTGDYTSSWYYSKEAGRWVKSKGSTTDIPRGSAIMLKRTAKDHPLGDGFYIMGKPASAGVAILLLSDAESPLYSLIAPPNVDSESTDVNLNMTWTNVETGDRLAINTANGPKLYGYTQTSARGVTPKTYAWADASTGSTTGIVIPRGEGAWFISKAGGKSGKKVTWGSQN